jgi:hypothetical protein
LKHVRSEKDPYSLMRMLQVNVFNAEKLAIQAAEHGSRKFFCVSTDKAANPANMMGATKRIMEMFVMRLSGRIPVSSARFANVAFSDGSLLHGFDMRLAKQQPIAAPADVFRYFITEEEAGQLCLLSCVLAGNRELFFPKMGGARNLLSFSRIAESYLRAHGYEPVTCESEKEARERAGVLIPRGKWPCFFFASDTTGEKIVEEFYTSGEDVDLSRFSSIGVIRDQGTCETEKLEVFRRGVGRLTDSGQWGKEDVVSLVEELLDDFRHDDKHRYLDERM